MTAATVNAAVAGPARPAHRIRCEVDLAPNGRSAGHLRAPLSRNTSGWGVVMIPIMVVAAGSGPTVLLTAGVHGDEYEGQIALSEFARRLDPAMVQGRVIMLPALNLPAVEAATRLSPVDQRDLNRCFPGRRDGTFSEMLADFVTSVLLPLVDVSIDLHTAGHSMEAAPSTNMHLLDDALHLERTLRLAEAFGAPFNVLFAGVDEGGTLTSAVEARGILSLGTELGGWGRVSVEGTRIARRGILGALRHLGVLDPEARVFDCDPGETAAPTRHMIVPGAECYLAAPADGVFEPAHLAGAEVQAGEYAGWLHSVADLDRAALPVRYAASGVLWMAAGPGRVRRGDVVAVVMQPYPN